MTLFALSAWHLVTYTFWHWRTGEGYQWWSGIGSVFTPKDLIYLWVGVAFFRHHNCEYKGCWRPGHRHPDHGRPVCRKHYHADVMPALPAD